MNRYKTAIDYLYTQLPMFQRTGPAAYKHSLGNTLLLDAMYGHPHRKFKSVHVAGTNGKGSVSHMLASVMQSAGYRTGLYTSPHLKDFRERIRVDGEMISEDFVADWTEDFRKKNQEAGIEPSFFELTVAMAFDYFAKEAIDIAIVEVGLGGRLDSTNIITPEISVITNISYDHTSLLGETLPLIAAEKAGIIKPGIPVVISQRQEEVEQVLYKKHRESMHRFILQVMNMLPTMGLLIWKETRFLISARMVIWFSHH
jgi:dihydrofolate synthase / folylpolyglutamate synthase